jgi:hypothetical protein
MINLNHTDGDNIEYDGNNDFIPTFPQEIPPA